MDNKMIDLTNINDSKLDSQFDLDSEWLIVTVSAFIDFVHTTSEYL
jgi:hypothetical protein